MSRFETSRFDFEPAVVGNDHQQGLRRRDHAADRVDGELLHHAVDGSGQSLQRGLALGLDQVLRQPVYLLLGFGEFVRQAAPVFGHGLAARLADRRHRRLRFTLAALLNAEFFLLLDQQLQDLEIGDLRAQLPFHQRLADIDALLDHRDRRLELVDGRPGGGVFGLLLRLLPRQGCDLGAMLGDLVLQQLTLGADQYGIGARGRDEVRRMVVTDRKRRAQPRGVELLGEQIILEVVAFGGVDGRIELDQDVAGLNRLPVLHPDGADHAGFERLDDLGTPARHDLAGGRGHDVDGAPPGPQQRRAEQHDDGRPPWCGRSAMAASPRSRAPPAGTRAPPAGH